MAAKAKEVVHDEEKANAMNMNIQFKTKNAKALQLQVNRYNKARNFYENLGFTVLYKADFDIGNGYFMNDYVMELSL